MTLNQQIFNELNKIAKYPLPSYGIVAGQALAEIYFRLNNIDIHTRIKDIDVFLNTDSSNYKKEDIVYNFCKPKEQIHHHEFTEKHTSTTVRSFIEDAVEEDKSVKYSYQIFESYELENLNIIEIYLNKNLSPRNAMKVVLESFDINAIQIAFCLRTKQLYFTKEFEKFLQTKQLKITFFEKPLSSICRFLEKSEYYKGVNFDFHYEVNLVLTHYFRHNYKKKKNVPFTQILREKITKLSLENQKLLKQYFKITESSFDTFNVLKLKIKKEKRSKEVVLESSLSKDKLHSFYKKLLILPHLSLMKVEQKFNYLSPYNLSFEDKIKNFHSAKKQEEIEIIKKIVGLTKRKSPLTNAQKKFLIKYSDYDKKNTCYIIASETIKTVRIEPRIWGFNLPFRKNAREVSRKLRKNHIAAELLLKREFIEFFYSNKKVKLILRDIAFHGEYFYAIFIKKLLLHNIPLPVLFQTPKRILKKLSEHLELLELYSFYCENKKIPFDLQVLSDRIDYLEKNDFHEIIGLVESKMINIQTFFESSVEHLKFLMKRNQNVNSAPLLLPDHFLKFKTYHINHIQDSVNLSRVGKEMKHCVGGQSHSLKRFEKIYFDIYCENNKRYTLSVYVKESSEIFYKENNSSEEKELFLLKLSKSDFRMKRNILPPKTHRDNIKSFILNLEKTLNQDELFLEDYSNRRYKNKIKKYGRKQLQG